MNDVPMMPTMTSVSLWDFMDRLRLHAEDLSAGWKNAIGAKTAHPLDPEMCRKNADKWNALSEIFKEARSKIYQTAEDDFREKPSGI